MLEGRGTALSPKEAVEMLRKAATNEFGPAQRELGKCYLNGIGIKKDVDSAQPLLKRAAEQGDEEAIELLQKLRMGVVQPRRPVPVFPADSSAVATKSILAPPVLAEGVPPTMGRLQIARYSIGAFMFTGVAFVSYVTAVVCGLLAIPAQTEVASEALTFVFVLGLVAGTVCVMISRNLAKRIRNATKR
jgi:TPR repeat protein